PGRYPRDVLQPRLLQRQPPRRLVGRRGRQLPAAVVAVAPRRLGVVVRVTRQALHQDHDERLRRRVGCPTLPRPAAGGNDQTSAGSRPPSTRGRKWSGLAPIPAGCSSRSATASCVFRPLPVTQTTTSSSRPIRPCSTSLRVTATVTPPAVSAKIP